jgi:hypothetical protein
MAKAIKPFAKEADLCARFLSAIGEDWISYPETANWDILLVRKADGFQIGIQAKLRLNIDVINQALEDYNVWDKDRMGPDCRAVLVPDDASTGFGVICAYIGLTVIRVYSVDRDRRYGVWRSRHEVFRPSLPTIGGPEWDLREWYEWAPMHRHRLPEYVPDVAAGKPSPVQLTDWKIRAIKIAVIMEKRGYLTRADFKHVGMDHRRWLPSGNQWLLLDGGVYRASKNWPNFKRQHPRVYEEIAADYENWKPADPVMPSPQPRQESLI